MFYTVKSQGAGLGSKVGTLRGKSSLVGMAEKARQPLLSRPENGLEQAGGPR